MVERHSESWKKPQHCAVIRRHEGNLRLVQAWKPPVLNIPALKASGTRKQLANARRLARLIKAFNSNLSAFKLSPAIVPTMRGRWHTRWKSRVRHEERGIRVSAEGDTYSFSEEDALLTILDLAKEGELGRVRKCRFCRKWFSARVRHQCFCARTCQQSNFRTSEIFRARRKLYMRDYRRKENERK